MDPRTYLERMSVWANWAPRDRTTEYAGRTYRPVDLAEEGFAVGSPGRPRARRPRAADWQRLAREFGLTA